MLKGTNCAQPDTRSEHSHHISVKHSILSQLGMLPDKVPSGYQISF